MYEIWSVGHKPFEELKNKEVSFKIIFIYLEVYIQKTTTLFI